MEEKINDTQKIIMVGLYDKKLDILKPSIIQTLAVKDIFNYIYSLIILKV